MILGVALGIVMMLVSRAASRLVTPGDPVRGFLVVLLIMLGEFLVAAGALLAYYLSARGALSAFGIALVAAFLGSLVTEAVRTSRVSASRTSA